MSIDQNPLAEQTQYRIETSDSPHTEDGYWPGEPKALVCEHCAMRVPLTEEPSAGLWDLSHEPQCPNGGETPPDAVE